MDEKVSNSIFRKFNFKKYILENLNEDNINTYGIDSFQYLIENSPTGSGYTKILIKLIPTGWALQNVRVTIVKVQDNALERDLVSKDFLFLTNLKFSLKMDKLLKSTRNKILTIEEQEIIEELPISFVRECNINILRSTP